MVDKKVVEKIQKLLRLGTSSNEHEAKLAMERASDLMRKHQLSMSQVDVEEVKGTGMVRETHHVRGLKMKLHWVVNLAQACARLFDGEITFVKRQLHGTTVTFVGTPEDVAASRALFEHLYASWFGIVDADLKEAKKMKMKAVERADWLAFRETYGKGGSMWAPKDTMKFKAGHGLYFASAIWHRADEIAEARKKDVVETSTGTDLMVLKDALLKEEMKDCKVVRTRQSQGSDIGQVMGWRSGKKVPLGGAIE
jgi:hypothetical protein